MKRSAGILMPIFSLPNRFGIGCFSKEAYRFVDFLQGAGQSYWQILPIHPTGFGDSPYQAFSTFAGNPYFIDLETLAEEGMLTKEECNTVDFGNLDEEIDYQKLYETRFRILRKAYERSNISQNAEYQAFLAENNWWLSDYTLFMAVKEHFGGQSWQEWPRELRFRQEDELNRYREKLYFEVEFQMYLQFQFFRQYHRLKQYANERNIRIIGDIPIYVAMDSADVWTHPELFQLDEERKPTAVAGCPPDGFSENGQLWGNPLYRWEYHKETDYQWWMSRMWYVSRLYDVIRIDHFRGFDSYYSIPRGAETAAGGHWEKGPGMDFFHHAEQVIGRQEIIAEDLGYITNSVRQLVRENGFMGTKVLQFAFDSRDVDSAGDHLPHNYPENCVVYTGTHDNETLNGWFRSITAKEQKLARGYLCDWYTPQALLYRSFISLAMRSNAKLCIIPLQDYLGLDNRGRMNTPSFVGTNWKWRVKKDQLTWELQQEIREVTLRYGRGN